MPVSSSYNKEAWAMYPTCSRASFSRPTFDSSMLPIVGCESPAIIRNRVDLPAPLSPSRTYIVRALKQKLTSRIAATRPKIFVTLSTTTVAVPVAAFMPVLMADGLEKVDRMGSISCLDNHIN